MTVAHVFRKNIQTLENNGWRCTSFSFKNCPHLLKHFGSIMADDLGLSHPSQTRSHQMMTSLMEGDHDYRTRGYVLDDAQLHIAQQQLSFILPSEVITAGNTHCTDLRCGADCNEGRGTTVALSDVQRARSHSTSSCNDLILDDSNSCPDKLSVIKKIDENCETLDDQEVVFELKSTVKIESCPSRSAEEDSNQISVSDYCRDDVMMQTASGHQLMDDTDDSFGAGLYFYP